jgi:hypothetical protein
MIGASMDGKSDMHLAPWQIVVIDENGADSLK